MYRAIRYGTLFGALLLGAGCENNSSAPAESSFIPRPKIVEAAAMADSLGSVRLMGYAWDPEAFFTSFVECTQKCLPPIPALPPMLLDNNPLFLRSVVQGAKVTLQDRSGSAGPLATADSDPLGNWVLPKVPIRDELYYPFSTGEGELPTFDYFPVLSPLPPADYAPTVSLRPVTTADADGCWGIEASQLSTTGILQAIAKYLTSKGTPTTVAHLYGLTNRYEGVTVFWLYNPGFSSLRGPGAGTTVEASAGQVLNVEWAPPGVLPPPLSDLQSQRGFFVAEGAPVSSLGIVAVLVPKGSTNPVTYKFKDPTTDAATGRPWKYPDLTVAPTSEAVAFGAIQLRFATGTASQPERTACRPKQ